jgi:hypothetical protein
MADRLLRKSNWKGYISETTSNNERLKYALIFISAITSMFSSQSESFLHLLIGILRS